MNMEKKESIFFRKKPLKNILKQSIHIRSQDKNKRNKTQGKRRCVCVCVCVCVNMRVIVAKSKLKHLKETSK